MYHQPRRVRIPACLRSSFVDAWEGGMDQIDDYSKQFDLELRKICQKLRQEIDVSLSDGLSRLYHGAPVWFVDENPIVGYSLKKGAIALLFWSGQSFKESGLTPIGKYKAGEICYRDSVEIDAARLAKWLAESRLTVWDYKNLRKNNGKLEPL
jgi:hypothetical protein